MAIEEFRHLFAADLRSYRSLKARLLNGQSLTFQLEKGFQRSVHQQLVPPFSLISGPPKTLDLHGFVRLRTWRNQFLV